MKISLNWIKDYVALPEDMDLMQLSYDLTMSTVEVEGTEDLAKRFDNMVVGVIKEVLPHPNADSLKVCKTDIGGGDMKEIVCGGVNLRDGMRVAVSLPGAIVRWHGQGDPVEIKKSKLRGVESYGMICASSELGLADLFPAAEEAEIMDLEEFDFPAGTPLADALDLHDILLEIDNKSMTNRPDLWGHYGLAREIAALYDLPLKTIEPYIAPAGTETATVAEVYDHERCPRCMGIMIENVSVKTSPYLMRSRLWRVGQRPINALVDITNYVMFATGQPSHAYDADQIVDHIIVRRAEEGEKLALLNGKDLTLTANDLVISDMKEPVGLAGIMGGAKDSILPTTHRVLLENANFESRGIRKTVLRYDNRTEASARYEKALDPDRCAQSVAMAMELFSEIYPEMKVTGYTDVYPQKHQCAEIDVSLSWLASRLGQVIPNEVIAKKLGALGFTVTFDGDNMHVVAPTWRSTGDVSIKDDIMEEVARMQGYENFEETPISTTFTGAINQLDKNLVRNIKEYLAFRCGMNEVFTYPWMSDKYLDAIVGSTEGVLALSTPPSPTEKYLRCSLLPNLCEAVVKNERYFDSFAIFEEAQVFFDKDYTSPNDPCELLPLQRRYVSGALTDSYDNVVSLFRRAKGIVENMARYTHMEALTFSKKEKPSWADDTVWLNVWCGNVKVGELALLSKKASMDCGIKNLATMLFELDTDAMVPLRSRDNTFTHLPEFPMTDYDVSLLFDTTVVWEDIAATVMGKGGDPLLHGVEFVDEYRGKQVPEGKKSVTLRLKIGSLTKTLTSQEIEQVAATVIKRLCKKLNAAERAN
ncbi:MAG: phenylalanine--tRNA ligase subunit beta [Oscillospiraceae bacterium]|nr:phenylalanine--tRNA ligase subunit beta [Oscillospiraceae bacterium]